MGRWGWDVQAVEGSWPSDPGPEAGCLGCDWLSKEHAHAKGPAGMLTSRMLCLALAGAHGARRGTPTGTTRACRSRWRHWQASASCRQALKLLSFAATLLVGAGQCMRWSQLNGLVASPDAVQVAAGGRHTLALADNNTLWAFGNNESGQLAAPASTAQPTPQVVQGLPRGCPILFVAAGGDHSAAVVDRHASTEAGSIGEQRRGVDVAAKALCTVPSGCWLCSVFRESLQKLIELLPASPLGCRTLCRPTAWRAVLRGPAA